MQQHTSFLELVAKDLLDRFGTDLTRVKVIFPGRRARLYLNKYLYSYAQKPVWAPQYSSIEELFAQYAQTQLADPILLTAILHRCYVEVYQEEHQQACDETLDKFYFFGEIILSDFDDIDKNMAAAEALFTNLDDLELLRDSFSHLSEEQRQSISQYFKTNFYSDTELQKAFRSRWNLLSKVYPLFKKRLAEQGIAYSGMLMREVVEGLTNEDTAAEILANDKDTTFVFVGFNVLSKCEQRFFKQVQNQALYYWDYADFYLEQETDFEYEAGRFIRQNILDFGSALPEHHFQFADTLQKKNIFLIESPSENGQASYLPQWVESLQAPSFTEPSTAIVLCNEAILPTVAHSLPSQNLSSVNITMGFPLLQTPICSFLEALTELQTNGVAKAGESFRYSYLLAVLRHPYADLVVDKAQELAQSLSQNKVFFPTKKDLPTSLLFSFTQNTANLARYLLDIVLAIGVQLKNTTSDEEVYQGLYQESVFRTYQILQRLLDLLQQDWITLEKPMFLKLLKRLLSTTQVPFHGEPLSGLQIMGVLETRNLDFTNLIMLSTNEGKMPGTSYDNSFIPQFLRKHFGLSTIEHQDSVYAYYFYRLLQRVQNISLVYTSSRGQMGKSEMSRFLLQLLVDKRFECKKIRLTTSVQPLSSSELQAQKTPELMQQLLQKYNRKLNPEASTLSPSALNMYIDCPFKFYLHYIEGLQAEEEVNDELDHALFGSLFHYAAELLYQHITGIKKGEISYTHRVQKEDLQPYVQKDVLLQPFISKAFDRLYFQRNNVPFEQYDGVQQINFHILHYLLKRLVQYDLTYAPFTLCALEYPIKGKLNLNKQLELKMGGFIDRVDYKDGVLRIIDYKTGSKGKDPASVESLFTAETNRANHVLQTCTYASLLRQSANTRGEIAPSLLYIRECHAENYNPTVYLGKSFISDFSVLEEEFTTWLRATLEQLFDPDIPFTQTPHIAHCEYCPFNELCKR